MDAQDCWQIAPADGKAWLEQDGGDCTRRALRGGSWNLEMFELRSAYRFWNFTVNRYYGIGFRLAQDSP
jgi:formylglycine-generating enzyme required for sulfatase activity